MEEFIKTWLPVIVSVVLNTAVGVVVKNFTKGLFSKSEDSLASVRKNAEETEKKANNLLTKVEEERKIAENTLKEAKETKAEVKDMLETNKAVLEENKLILAEMTSIRNELNTIKRQNARDLRRQ